MKEYLEKHKRPIVAVDVVVFTVCEDELKVLMIKRCKDPFPDHYTLIGTFMNIDETTEEAATRALRDKAGIDQNLFIEQLYTFDSVERDPRDRILSVSYYTVVHQHALHIDAEKAELVHVKEVDTLGFDHKQILDYALQRLRWKMEYTTVAFGILPDLFTLRDLHQLYETVLDKDIDYSNFRKKILKLGIVERTHEKEKNVSHKPASYYRFHGKIGHIVEIF